MKKIFLLLAVFCGFSLFAATAESEVESIIRNLFSDLRAMNGSTLLSQVTADYLEIDEEGNKTNYEEFKAIMKELDDMKILFNKGLNPQATLTDIFLAISELNEEDVDPEALNLTREIGSTAEGKKLVNHYRNALAAMKQIYTGTIDKESDSLQIFSITVSGEKAVAVYRITREEKPLKIQLELIKKGDKWLIKKSSAAVIK